MSFAKWGNSLAARLLKALRTDLGPNTGDEIQTAAKAPEELIAERDLRRQQAVERMRRRAWAPPEGHTFDRNAAHER